MIYKLQFGISIYIYIYKLDHFIFKDSISISILRLFDTEIEEYLVYLGKLVVGKCYMRGSQCDRRHDGHTQSSVTGPRRAGGGATFES